MEVEGITIIIHWMSCFLISIHQQDYFSQDNLKKDYENLYHVYWDFSVFHNYTSPNSVLNLALYFPHNGVTSNLGEAYLYGPTTLIDE